jgi:hypothetical protein
MFDSWRSEKDTYFETVEQFFFKKVAKDLSRFLLDHERKKSSANNIYNKKKKETTSAGI